MHLLFFQSSVHMKNEIRIAGISDASFDKFRDHSVQVIATIYRGGQFMDGLFSCTVKVDGTDATIKITNMFNKSRFKHQLRCLLLKGIAVGGFNVIDIVKLHKLTGIPVMVIMRKKPKL